MDESFLEYFLTSEEWHQHGGAGGLMALDTAGFMLVL